MSGICNSSMPVGTVECLKKMGKMSFIIIDRLNVEFQGTNNLINSSENIALMQEIDPNFKETSSYIIKVTDYEVTTADPAVTTFDNTRNVVTNRPVPSGTLYADMSFCDQQNLVKVLTGGTYRARIVTVDNEVVAYRQANGIIKGFKCEITAVTKGLPQKADIDKNVPIYFNFVSYEEFENAIIVRPEWSVALSLLEAVPTGMSLYATSAYNAGAVGVQANIRCVGGFEGLVTEDFVIVGGNVTDAEITAAETSLGGYNLTIQKGVIPTDLSAGDFVIIQVQKKTGAIVDYISNRFTINV